MERACLRTVQALMLFLYCIQMYIKVLIILNSIFHFGVTFPVKLIRVQNLTHSERCQTMTWSSSLMGTRHAFPARAILLQYFCGSMRGLSWQAIRSCRWVKNNQRTFQNKLSVVYISCWYCKHQYIKYCMPFDHCRSQRERRASFSPTHGWSMHIPALKKGGGKKIIFKNSSS